MRIGNLRKQVGFILENCFKPRFFLRSGFIVGLAYFKFVSPDTCGRQKALLCSVYSQFSIVFQIPFTYFLLEFQSKPYLKMTTDHDQVGDCPDDLESVEYEEDVTEEGSKLASTLPNSLVEAIKSHQNAEPKAPLPPAVKRRVNALKKLQLETTNIETKFFKEVHDLECKYHRLYVPLYEKRNTIVNGEYEPADEECEWQSDDEDEGLSSSLKEKVKLEEVNGQEKPDASEKGIPEFWLTIFKNCNLLSEMMQIHDYPIITHLTDIKTICTEDPMVRCFVYFNYFTAFCTC